MKAGYKIEKAPLSNKFEEGEMIIYSPKEKRKRREKEPEIADNSLPAVVVERLAPDKLIIEAQKVCKKELGSHAGQVQHLSYYTFNLTISLGTLDRALNFLDLFIKHLRKCKGEIKVEPHHTLVFIDEEKFEIALREKQNRIKKEKNDRYSWNEYDYTPSGILIFKVGVESWQSKEWKDGSIRIEDHIPSIIDHLKVSARKEKEHRIELEQRRREEAERNRLKADFEKRQAEELAKFIKLNTAFEHWQKAQNMRKYL